MCHQPLLGLATRKKDVAEALPRLETGLRCGAMRMLSHWTSDTAVLSSLLILLSDRGYRLLA
jgi:hypothetical protein